MTGARQRSRSADTARFGHFALERELGRGGQATVYAACDLRSGATVALKLFGHAAHGDALARRWAHEVEALSRVLDPAIPRIHEHGVLHGVCYLATELVEGAPWSAHASTLPADFTERARAAAALCARLAHALHAAHAAGVIHADLKPSNLMIARDGRVVVLDFGAAALLDAARSADGAPVGTPAYMAPERFDPTLGELGPWTDVWSIGVVLVETLTGRTPFCGATEHAVCGAVLRGAPDLAAFDAAPGLAVVLENALAKDVRRRYASAHELALDLERFGRGEPVRARRAGAWQRLADWVARERGTALAVFGSAAGLLAWTVVSTASAVRLDRALAANLRATDLESMPALRRDAEHALWPALPERVPAMDAWLADARALAGRVEAYQGEARRLHAAGESGQGELPRLEAFLAQVAELGPLMADVERRRSLAEATERESVVAHADAWRRACAEIAAHPRYGGLALAPQMGLVPLGTDPRSGLFEFGHPRSGELPTRDPKTGVLSIDERSSLVFVLLPGGSFCMGATPDPALAAACGGASDRLAERVESPVEQVELAPFFLSKFELTQAQWLRLERVNPSALRPEVGALHGTQITLAHPVVQVSLHECARLAEHHGFALPTEAQWEYAARAGSTTPWSCGAERESLRGHANLADRSYARLDSSAAAAGLSPAAADWPDLDDGFPYTAPVGSFAPNAFGLHDVHGNVAEFVRDGFGSYEFPTRAGDGEREGASRDLCVYRGGWFANTASALRSSKRGEVAPESRLPIGFRPARELDP